MKNRNACHTQTHPSAGFVAGYKSADKSACECIGSRYGARLTARRAARRLEKRAPRRTPAAPYKSVHVWAPTDLSANLSVIRHRANKNNMSFDDYKELIYEVKLFILLFTSVSF